MWQELNHSLYKQFKFDNFTQAWTFMSAIAEIAEAQQHHPRWENEWNIVQIWLTTHDKGKIITAKDRYMAQAIDNIYDKKSQRQESIIESRLEDVKVFADGGSRGNPGPSASGFVILDKEDKILFEKGIYLGITTNNQAEYTALKIALEECCKLDIKKVNVYMDSMLVVNQMKGIFKISNRDLWPIHDSIKKLSERFKDITFQHVPREFNKLADAVVNRTLDEALGIHSSLKKV